jgi:hypothetical protein
MQYEELNLETHKTHEMEKDTNYVGEYWQAIL